MIALHEQSSSSSAPPLLEPADPIDEHGLPAWFQEQVRAHESAVRNYLRRRFGLLRDEDDIVQDSFLRLWRAGRSAVNTRAFLLTVARNLACDSFRRNRTAGRYVVAVAELPDQPDPLPNPWQQLVRTEERAALLAAIDQLHPRCREAVMLRCIHGLSQREIAARLGLAIGTVENHLVRGRRKCAALLLALEPGESRNTDGARQFVAPAGMPRHADA